MSDARNSKPREAHTGHWNAVIQHQALSQLKTLHVIRETQTIADVPSDVRRAVDIASAQALERCCAEEVRGDGSIADQRRIEQLANRELWDELKSHQRTPPWPAREWVLPASYYERLGDR